MEEKKDSNLKKSSEQKGNLNLPLEDYIEVSIIGDGNCFYRCLSQAIDHTQENYQYYRTIIYNYIYAHKEELKFFFPQFNNETTTNYNHRYLNFINTIKNNGAYAGDFELSTASIILQRLIKIYRHTFNNYEFLTEYRPTNISNESLNIVYRNNNHFQLLLEKDLCLNSDLENIENINTLHKNLELSIENLSLKNIDKMCINNTFEKKYVPYKRPECTGLYNEIYKLLKDKEIPERLESQFQKNLKIYNQKKARGDIDYETYNPFIKKNNIDHFSKWLFSYALKEKSANEVLIILKK